MNLLECRLIIVLHEFTGSFNKGLDIMSPPFRDVILACHSCTLICNKQHFAHSLSVPMCMDFAAGRSVILAMNLK